MDGEALQGRRILVVEDELLVAMGIEATLRDMGCEVVGPYPTLAEAVSALDGGGVDGAVLDVNLRGELSLPLAARLSAEGTPTILCSGYAEVEIIPEAFSGLPRLAKPYTEEALKQALTAAFNAASIAG